YCTGGYFMNSARRIGFILAAMLMVNSFAGAPAIAQQDEATALNKRVIELFQAGKFAEAVPLAQRAVAIREKAFGPNHPNVGASSSNLAGLHGRRGRDADAEPLYKRVLAIVEKARGPGHPDVAIALLNLAEIYRSQGRYADAEPFYKRLLTITESTFGADN